MVSQAAADIDPASADKSEGLIGAPKKQEAPIRWSEAHGDAENI